MARLMGIAQHDPPRGIGGHGLDDAAIRQALTRAEIGKMAAVIGIESVFRAGEDEAGLVLHEAGEPGIGEAFRRAIAAERDLLRGGAWDDVPNHEQYKAKGA